MKRQEPRDSLDAEIRAERALYEYLKRTGKIIPQDPEEIAAVLKRLRSKPIELPERLRAALTAERACQNRGKILKMPRGETKEVIANLARAARDGGTLSPEVEDQMRRDRAIAEREADCDE